jgi:hypothetical protein
MPGRERPNTHTERFIRGQYSPTGVAIYEDKGCWRLKDVSSKTRALGPRVSFVSVSKEQPKEVNNDEFILFPVPRGGAVDLDLNGASQYTIYSGKTGLYIGFQEGPTPNYQDLVERFFTSDAREYPSLVMSAVPYVVDFHEERLIRTDEQVIRLAAVNGQFRDAPVVLYRATLPSILAIRGASLPEPESS